MDVYATMAFAVDLRTKTRGSYYIEEDEPVKQTVQDAPMHHLRKVVPTSERSGGAHE